MSKNPAISVVIPVYNQEKYVGKCIRSVLSQSFQDFEVILVNDGSKDMSLNVCQEYAEKDFRIAIIDKQNQGVAQARKDGVLKASGDYIFFLDSDDYITTRAFEILYQIVQEKDVDVAVGNFDVVYDDWGILKKKSVLDERADKIIEQDKIVPLIIGLNSFSDRLLMQSTGRLYRRSCILKALEEAMYPLFPSYNEGEDIAFNFALAPFLSSMWITNDVVYHYRYGGITSGDFASIRNGGQIFDDRYEYCAQNGLKTELPLVLKHYSRLLEVDVVCQLHYHVGSEREIRTFVLKELNRRKIVLWARQHVTELPDEMRNDVLIQSVLNCDVDAFFNDVENRERFLRKHHYWKMKFVGGYQKIVDAIRQR